MKKSTLILLVCLIVLGACNLKNKKGKNDNTLFDTIVPTTETFDNHGQPVKAAYAVKVKINYDPNKPVMKILPLLPDSAMRSFTWSRAERQGLLDMVKAHNYYIDTTKNYNTIKKILPYFFQTQIVDGVFSIASYQASDGDQIIITNDQNGDSKDINCYELTKNILISLPVEQVLGPYRDYLMIDPQSPEGKKFLENADAYMEYSFLTKDKIIIDVPFTKYKAYSYLKGNSLTLVFNPATRKFDLGSIEWSNGK